MLFRFLVMSELLKIPVYFVLFSSFNKAGPLWKKNFFAWMFQSEQKAAVAFTWASKIEMER